MTLDAFRPPRLFHRHGEQQIATTRTFRGCYVQDGPGRDTASPPSVLATDLSGLAAGHGGATLPHLQSTPPLSSSATQTTEALPPTAQPLEAVMDEAHLASN
ncbi:hypothetical protein E2C01_056641 [Portunus trituberculatus]|uniref:Uncharacterized protein n=1 Tax=Portunus trituberculatus TaxID=210409 RepID=A0A5B7GYA3_PORTR|nr:hypothetical protein [Portunus trituberculatus]